MLLLPYFHSTTLKMEAAGSSETLKLLIPREAGTRLRRLRKTT
jgi:hypothetical protein